MSQLDLPKIPGRVPDPNDVAEAFQNHIDNFSDTSGEVAYQQFQNEESLRRQYSGRVLFELLQNALDRAERRVTVEICEVGWPSTEYALVVGNDGAPIHVDPEYNYDRPPETRDGRRPDFNALCSLHTSNKRPEESVGNKGIGFRSVFWLGNFVRVWSRFADDPGWWGLELHSPLEHDTWTRRRDIPEVRYGQRNYLDGELPIEEGDQRPSFHFPLPLGSDSPPTPNGAEELSTVVVAPISEGRRDELEDSVDAIREGHLNFVGLFEDRQGLTVNVETPSDSFKEYTWPQAENSEPTQGHLEGAGQHAISAEPGYASGAGSRLIYHWASPELASHAKEAEHELSKPGAAVAWPAPGDDEPASESNSKVYGYLPTLINSPFGVDIQGDFQLRTDRTGLRLDDENIGEYNTELLKVAAELHLYAVITAVGLSHDRIEWEWIDPEEVGMAPSEQVANTVREDLWMFLDPKSANTEVGEVFANHLESLLFAGSNSTTSTERYRNWAVIATAFFDARERWPVHTYQEFWLAAGNWIDRAASYGSHTKNWRLRAAAMGDALREERGKVAPVTATSGPPRDHLVPAVSLPERGTSDQPAGPIARHTRQLFLRRSDATNLELPEPLRDANRAVTSFEFPAGFDSDSSPQPLGADPFNRWDVLQELRQLPNDIQKWSPEPLAEDEDRAIEQQQELLGFAMALYALKSQGGNVPPAESDMYGPGWRALANRGYSENACRAGRSIATLFLPAKSGDWEPARQLTIDRVDKERLPSAPDGIDVDEFLHFLGVTPAPPEDGAPLTLVDGGETDITRAVPPALTTAESEWHPLRLGRGPGADDDVNGTAFLRSLNDGWDWLEPLIVAEREERQESTKGDRLKLELLDQLRDNAWIPVGESESTVDPPAFLDDPAPRVAPKDVTLVSEQQRQFPAVLWSVTTESSIDSDLLSALGAIPGTDTESLSENNAKNARRLLQQLRKLTEHRIDVVEGDTHARGALTSLVDRLLNTIAREHDPGEQEPMLPLLVYSGTSDNFALSDRPLEWTNSDNEVWIPTDGAEREQMRRFFPQVPLVAATVGRNTLRGYGPLAECELEISRRVHPEHKGSEENEIVTSLEDTLGQIIPHLLALTESTTRVDVESISAAERWRSRVVRYVDDAWVDFEVTLGEESETSDAQFKESYNHALYLQDDPPTVIFDTSPDRDGPPPLDEFGKPLAKLLLGDSGGNLGPTFAHALGAFDSGGIDRVERILRKHDAMPLVESYERHLRQLDEAEYEALRQEVQANLSELGLELRDSWTRLSRITPDDLDTSDVPKDLNSHEVKEALDSIDLSEEQEPFRPQFSCSNHYRSVWKAWRTDWDERLVSYLVHLFDEHADLTVSEEEFAEQLDEFVRETACKHVNFEPEAAVRWWLETEPFGAAIPKEDIPAPEDLEDNLREFSPRYDPVREDPTDDHDFHRPVIGQAEPSESRQGVVTLQDLKTEWERTKAVGDDAERAARSWIVDTTAECLKKIDSDDAFEDICRELRSVIPGSGKTDRVLHEALMEWHQTHDREPLKRGLHVSQTWDGIGFDLVGLEEKDSGFEPVRYEVKSLQQEGSRFKIHLSRNQLSIYRKVHFEDGKDQLYDGDWRLLGVRPDGSAVDLTSQLEDLPSQVRSLQTNGYDHDGLLIYVETAAGG